jgi:hypothetical protein
MSRQSELTPTHEPTRQLNRATLGHSTRRPWTRHVALDGDLARAEPKRLRYCLLHTAGQIAHTGRQTRLRIPASWPWATELVIAFKRIEFLRLIV